MVEPSFGLCWKYRSSERNASMGMEGLGGTWAGLGRALAQALKMLQKQIDERLQ